jgi:cyanophycinase-like exopeptidase
MRILGFLWIIRIMPRIFALMGSGENSPAMVTPHQNILKKLGKDSNRINLDTPYGFQENADELTEKIRKYFEVNVGFPISDSIHRNSKSNSISDIENADWVFAGPGSPTYALKIWQATGAEKALKELLTRGTVVMASAAAMSTGAKVMPVYEMYKVGEDPYWLDGLNLLEGATGIRAAVVAHYNNNQGGTHDTRFCFIGENRMRVLESQLDSDIGILGIDEHTGIAFDLDEGTAEIFGKGVVTFKKGASEKTFAPKEVIRTTAFSF